MAILDKDKTANFTRGSDITWHRFALFRKNIARLSLVFIAVSGLLFLALFFKVTDYNERSIALSNRLAWLADTLFLPKLRISVLAKTESGEIVTGKYPAHILLARTDDAWNEMLGRVYYILTLSLLAGGGAAFLLLNYQLKRGHELSEDEFLRGARIVSPEQLKKLVENPSTWTIGGVPIPADKLARNILFTGAMGTGKSVALLELLDEARRTGKKCVVYDKTGEFTEYFYRPGQDVLLNPLDNRCAPWAVFADLQRDFDYANLAAFFVPENKKSADPVWDNAARILLEDVFRIVHSLPSGERTMKKVSDIITQTPLPELAAMLAKAGAASAGTINEKNERGSESIRLTLAASPAMKFFRYLPAPAAGQAPFSIREWVQQPEDSWLFLTSRSDQHEAIRPFVSVWVELAMLAAMEGRPSRDIRLCFFLDELASLNRMRGLEIGLTEARKFGVVSVLGLQNLAQLDHLYGQEMARVLAGNCQTKLILRVEDEATAKRYADLLGKEEIEERSEGNSFGEASARDGVNISSKRAERHLVLPSEIQTLPDLVGYLKLPGAFPIARVQLAYKSRTAHQPDYVPRPGLEIQPLAPEQDLSTGSEWTRF